MAAHRATGNSSLSRGSNPARVRIFAPRLFLEYSLLFVTKTSRFPSARNFSNAGAIPRNKMYKMEWDFRAFCMRQVPFAFEFESEWLSGNSVTKQLLNYHLAILEKSVEWLNAIWSFDWLYPNLMNGNLETVLLPNYHSAIWTQTQTQKGPEVFRKHEISWLFKWLDAKHWVQTSP